MPAIYKFSLPGWVEENGWGWHRAVELVEAVNNILASQGKEAMAPRSLVEEFPFVDPHIKEDIGPKTRNLGYTSIDADGNVWNTHCENWLESAVESDSYLPARVGMQLINAVRRLFRSSLRKMLA